ncbi:MAG: hypothetical protein IJR87_10450 [Bacteroidaceae bacterium]|nr:hypothetical protein [Bacteroidaceae bacterium]
MQKCKILHQDAYSRLLYLLKQACISPLLTPTRALLCKAAADFGQFQLPAEMWKNRGSKETDFIRRKTLVLTVLRQLENVNEC